MSAEVLITEEAAELLSMHPKALLRQVREGRIPAARVGRRWRFSRRQLLQWLEQGGNRYEELVDQGLLQATKDSLAEEGDDIPLDEVRKRLGL